MRAAQRPGVIAEVVRRLEEAENATSTIDERVEEIERLLTETVVRTSIPPPPPSSVSINAMLHAAETVVADVQRNESELIALRFDVERVSAQVVELSDVWARSTPDVAAISPASPEGGGAADLGEIRESLSRLARDQERIEALFREDLAALEAVVRSADGLHSWDRRPA